MAEARPAPLTDETLEDCLRAVHRLEGQGRPIDLGEVAALRIPAPLAQQAMRELEACGLVRDGQAEGLTLTGEGRRRAAGILRRHRVSERLFADILRHLDARAARCGAAEARHDM